MSVRSTFSLLAGALVLSGLAACGQAEGNDAEGASAADIVAFVDVNVIPMDQERMLEGQTVLVEGDRIMAIGAADEVDVPAGATQVEGAGRYLMPGLAEMHGHIPGSNDRAYAEDVLFLYVSNGVTTVRGMAGDPLHLELRERTASGELLGPTIFAAGPGFGGHNAGTPEEAERLVHEQIEAGYDLIKVFGMPTESYEQMAETAHAAGMPFGGHIPAAVGLVGALDARQTSIDHYDRYVEFLVPEDVDWEGRQAGFFGSGVVDLADPARIPEAVQRTLDAGTWNVPTLSLVEHLASPEPAEEMIQWPEMRYMPQEVRDSWVRSKHEYAARDDFQPEATRRLVDIRRQLTKALHDAGAPIVLGSDAPQFFNVPGFSIHHEMEMMVNAGLTPYQVLETGTRNAGEYFDMPEEFGTIEVGSRADLILLEANPLEDIGNVRQRAGVMVRGRWLPEAEIQQRLEEIAARVE